MAEKVISLAKVRALTSALIGRSRLANLVGKTFEGQRDLYKYLGYKRNVEFDDYLQRYEQGGIAGRIVDAYPNATWRSPPVLFDAGKQPDDEQSEFVSQFREMAGRLKLFHYFERADRISGVGRYSVLLIGVKGGRALETPMPKLKGPDDILFVAPYSEGNAIIEEFEKDPSNPRFGLPLFYTLNLGRDLNVGAKKTSQENKVKVHHSRILHVAEALTEDDIFGRPRLKRIWNYLDDLDKIMGGSAEAVWRVVDRGLHFNVDKEMELDSDDEDDFVDEIEEYLHQYKRYIKTRGIEINSIGGETVDINSPFESVVALISGTVGIPTRILLGSERGQLASSSDERNFASRVKERQESFAEPMILRTFIDRTVEMGALSPETNGYGVKWPDVSTLTEREKADVAARYGQAISHVSKQEKGREVMPLDEFRKRFIND